MLSGPFTGKFMAIGPKFLEILATVLKCLGALLKYWAGSVRLPLHHAPKALLLYVIYMVNTKVVMYQESAAAVN